MSPILVRPVREQLEHDRIIRLLQARYRRKHDVAVNIGAEQATPVAGAAGPIFPDLVLYGQDKGRKLQGTVEVETGESVNALEALSQWAPLSRLKVPFILYVPPGALDAVRRLCASHQIEPSEIWTYHAGFEQVRFTLAHRASPPKGVQAPRAHAAAGRSAAKGRPAAAARKAAASRTVARAPAKARARVAARAPARRAGGARSGTAKGVRRR